MADSDPDEMPISPAPAPSRVFWSVTVIGILALLALCVLLALAASRA
jgi:hypothetical protein